MAGREELGPPSPCPVQRVLCSAEGTMRSLGIVVRSLVLRPPGDVQELHGGGGQGLMVCVESSRG